MRKNVFSLKFRCMVHVKTSKEYELHQDLIVLFSETLMRAILEDLVTQDSVDFCDPSLMFAIPRLAIVYGLLICKKEGPLNVDRSSAEFPTLFLPFKNLLRKIRELLYTLEANEVRKAAYMYRHKISRNSVLSTGLATNAHQKFTYVAI